MDLEHRLALARSTHSSFSNCSAALDFAISEIFSIVSPAFPCSGALWAIFGLLLRFLQRPFHDEITELPHSFGGLSEDYWHPLVARGIPSNIPQQELRQSVFLCFLLSLSQRHVYAWLPFLGSFPLLTSGDLCLRRGFGFWRRLLS